MKIYFVFLGLDFVGWVEFEGVWFGDFGFSWFVVVDGIWIILFCLIKFGEFGFGDVFLIEEDLFGGVDWVFGNFGSGEEVAEPGFGSRDLFFPMCFDWVEIDWLFDFDLVCDSDLECFSWAVLRHWRAISSIESFLSGVLFPDVEDGACFEVVGVGDWFEVDGCFEIGGWFEVGGCFKVDGVGDWFGVGGWFEVGDWVFCKALWKHCFAIDSIVNCWSNIFWNFSLFSITYLNHWIDNAWYFSWNFISIDFWFNKCGKCIFEKQTWSFGI